MYDVLGNRGILKENGTTVETYLSDEVNEYTDISGNTDIDYDLAGNLTADKDGYSYEYDYENRVTAIYDDSSTLVAEYTYDAFGRRIAVNDAKASKVTYYYYNGDQVVLETDTTDSSIRSFVFGNYIDEVLVMLDLDDPCDIHDYFYGHDHLYSPTVVFDDAGVVKERYEYDAYGKVTVLDDDLSADDDGISDIGNPYYFTGRRLDGFDYDADDDEYACAIMYYRARYYDPDTGRFLQRDPAGYVDGMNAYEYVTSNPANALDPYGLMSKKEFRGKLDRRKELFKNVYKALETLGVMALNGNLEGDSYLSQAEEVKRLNDQYLRYTYIEMMEYQAEFINQWWVPYFASGMMQESLVPKNPLPSGVIGMGTEFLTEAIEAGDAVSEAGAEMLNRLDNTIMVVETTDKVLTVASFAGGATVLVKEAAKQGFKQGAKYLVMQVATIAVTQIAFTAGFEFAAEMGVDETTLRIGVASFQALTMYKAFRSKVGPTKTNTKKPVKPSKVQETIGGICFTADTEISTPYGYVRIDQITIGDQVWAYDFNKCQNVLSRVVRIFEKTTDQLVVIEVGDETIEATPEHPFWTKENGWTAAKDLKNGSLLRCFDGNWKHVKFVSFVEKQTPVFNLEIEGTHTYYVSHEDLLVHNDCRMFFKIPKMIETKLIPGKVSKFGDKNLLRTLKKVAGTTKGWKKYHGTSVNAVGKKTFWRYYKHKGENKTVAFIIDHF